MAKSTRKLNPPRKVVRASKRKISAMSPILERRSSATNTDVPSSPTRRSATNSESPTNNDVPSSPTRSSGTNSESETNNDVPSSPSRSSGTNSDSEGQMSATTSASNSSSTRNSRSVRNKRKLPTKKASLAFGRYRCEYKIQELREIEFLQKLPTLIPKLSFYRVLKETIQKYSEYRLTAEALLGMQEAAELYLTHFFEDAHKCSLHAKRVTLKPIDMQFVLELRSPFDKVGVPNTI